MSDSRERILKRLRANRLESKELPSLDQSWIVYDDVQRQFAEMVAAVGGRCETATTAAEAQDLIDTLPVFAPPAEPTASRKVCQLVPDFRFPAGAGLAPVALQSVEDPHDLEDVHAALIRADWGVAENGALWVTNQGLRQRAIFFIVQHLVAVVSADRIVHNMHEAYGRIECFSAAPDGVDQAMPEFGMFLAGPSKTADIEQSLIIGAHGARSLTVIVVDSRQPTQ